MKFFVNKVGGVNCMATRKYYAVRHGRQNKVIVDTWDECKALVDGFPKARFKSFLDYDDAVDFNNGTDTPLSNPRKRKQPVQKQFWDTEKHPCVERKSYFDPVKKIYFKNRCVRRSGPTMVGANYAPNNDTSIPWV